MALLILFLVPFHLLFLKADSQCPNSFDCGKFSFEFPFTSSSNPGCGMIRLDDCESGNPTIRSGHDYTITEKISSNQFLVHDAQIQGFLDNRGCIKLENLSMPQFYPISFTYSPNITIFTCFNQTPNAAIQDFFKHYLSFRGEQNNCQSDYTMVYYNISTGGEVEESEVPRECLTMILPMRTDSDSDSDNLLSLLTPNFTLEWNVPEGCSPNIGRNKYDCKEGNTRLKKILLIGGISIVSLASTFIILFIVIKTKRAKEKQEHDRDIELFLKNNGNLAPLRYRYSAITKMTKSFSVQLGKGGFGSVYKGQFPDGRLMAVKVLNESNGNGEDFMNEVASISRTSHVNIVALLGFCFEGSKRALIYDFMPYGSLEHFIDNNTASSPAESVLGWDKLFEIALGIARGLEYLHQGCSTRILHLDIKPQNILLDKDLNPRISDFGLAKLCPNRSSVVSMLVARGTIGYIAPEVFSRNFGEVSYKSDVYSYGMLLLEMVGGRRSVERNDVDHTSEIYFPHYIYRQLEEYAEGDGDPATMHDDEDERQSVKRNLMIVGLWCIQTNPKDRPSMTKVGEMLEGKLGSLEVPPKPYLYSPPRSAPSFSASESL